MRAEGDDLSGVKAFAHSASFYPQKCLCKLSQTGRKTFEAVTRRVDRSSSNVPSPALFRKGSAWRDAAPSSSACLPSPVFFCWPLLTLAFFWPETTHERKTNWVGAPGPTQPIAFYHRVHVNELHIPCAYCHWTAATRATPIIRRSRSAGAATKTFPSPTRRSPASGSIILPASPFPGCGSTSSRTMCILSTRPMSARGSPARPVTAMSAACMSFTSPLR